MDRIEEKESNRIVFWLFIDGLNKYEKDLVIQFRQKDNKNYPLSPTHLHHDIFMISLKQNDIIHDYNKLQYRYIIKDYKAKEITREIPLKKKYEQVIHIFDTPDEFTNKYFIGLLGQDLLIQNNKEQSLLKFIQPNTSIMILNHLRDFIDEYKFPQLFYKFYEYSIKIIIQKLYNFRNYEEDIELYFNFLDLMNRQDQIKYIKTQNIVEIARSLSQYFMIFMKSYQLDQNNSKRLRHKLIDLYSQNTNFEQRINILLSDHCVWTDEEASNHINKKEYNQILLQYPNQYIEFFSKQTANYKDLFIEQIKRIIMLLAENKNENIISVLKTQKDIFRKLPKSVINKLQNQLFEIKNDIYYKQKVQEIFDNMKDIVEFFNIPKYQLKRQVISTLSCLKHSSTEEKTLDFFIQTCMQYKIDVFSFEFLEHRFTMQYYYNQQLMESFIEQIIEINPFTNLKPILKKFYDKYTEYVQSQKIVDIIKLKTKYVGYLQKLYAKQKLILQKRESKSKQNQSDHIIKSNIDQLQKSSVSSQQKDLNISDNQWSNDILTDDRIKQMKEEQKQASELEGNQSILVEEKNLKEDLHKRQREISLTEESVKQFEQQLYIIVERIMTNTATKNLIEVTNLNELNEQERQLFDSIKDNISYLRMKRENQNESDFFKNYSEAKYYKGSDKDLTTVFNIFDQLAIERVNQLLENRQIYHIFGSSFINRFLPICDKSLKFYKVVEENVKKVNQSISQGLYNTEQIKEVCAQNFYEQIMDQFDIQANKQQLQEQIKQIENKDKNYRIFFYKFEEYLTEYYEIIQKTKISQLQLSQIPQFFQQFQQFDILSNKFLEVNNSKIVQSICTQLNTYQCNQTLKEIEQIKQQQDQVLQLGNLKTQIYQIRMANFSEMLFKLIENLYIFSNVIYGCDKGSIKNLDELNKIATLLLSNFIRQEENQQNQNSLLMMQQNIQNQENQQIIKQDQQQLQGYTLFNTEVSLNNLKPYFGDGLDEIIQNIKEFHSILGVQADLYQTEQNFKKCFTSTFYLDCFSIIQEVAETLKLDWKLQENVQMKSLQSLLLNYKDLKNQPIKVVMQIEISQQIIQDYQVIAREKDIQRNMELLIKSQHIIEHSKQNKVNNISYLDMRDFIGDNDYDLSSFLTVLNEFAQFFLELSETQSEIINNKKSILKAMIQLNNVIQNQIKTDSRVSQWEEIIKNFHKIASIQNNIDKKKSYLNLLKKMYTDGKTTIEIDNLRSQVTYLIECDQKCYSEQEINEISSRVLIEKNSIKAIFGQEKQQISQSQQKLTMANPNLNQEKLQILQQEQKMEKFKKQLELTQDLKQIIQEMISYGYFLFEKKQYIYNNKNNYYLQNMIDMNQQLQKFQNLLKDWKNEIERVTRKYPKFTFISYSYYPIIDQYLSKSIFEADLSQSLKQIIQYQVQTSPFNNRNINNIFQNYKNCEQQLKLDQIDFYDDRLNLIQQDFGYQNKAQNIENLKKQQHIKQIYKNACFFTSSEPGAGKTFAVKLKSQQYKKQLIRIPTNGDGDKDSLIKYLMKNIQDNSDQQRIYHIDLYENDHLDLDFTLFEMIILKSINFNSKSFLDLGSQSVFLVEINNTLRNSLVDQIHIKDYFEVNQVTFNINSFNILSFEEKHNQAAALTVFKYLKSIKIQQTSNNNTYFDQQQNIDELQKIKSIDTILFSKLLDEYLVQYLNTNQINPNFWQINNFINLFGSEMQKMENSAYLQIPIVERAQLRLGLRTIIINKSFELCRKVSLSCLKNTYNQSNSVSNEQLLTNKAGSLIPFSSFLQDFVTFQEQDEACITSFFQNAETTPQPIKDMYAQYKLQLLHFDQEQRPEVLVNWLILLCNQHIQNFYKNQKEITFDKISNTELSKEVEKIIIQKDNFFKIAMIFMRIRSLTPIIIMGEAGIGKTALIRLLSLIMEANFNTKIIHGGVTEEEVIEFIEQSEAQLRNNSKKKTVLFFDEVNTNKLVCGLFKEIIVDRYLKGRKLHPNIIPIAALNPYKLKSEEQQKIIQIQIHGGIKQDLVNKIKGSDLEYTVNPIPDSMYSFSWNYGGLNQNDEKTYIQQILLQMNKELQLNSKVSYKIEMIKNTISELVFLSQEYMRKLMGTISACSLRDVKRFVTLLKNNINFLKTCSNLSQKNSLKIQDQNIQILAVYLSFYINYCVRIPLQEKREEYLKLLTNHYREFTNNQMQSEFDFVEKFLINQIDVPLGIAKNYSLRQNAFILFICIVNKIPVCLIGPPGSSKTLSLRLLIQSMQGVNSRSELFKKYPALMPQYYQGHIQSTSERIMEVFEQASKKQQGFNSKEVGNQNLSLVYIDEIGLAEISPHNPLKVLHATLEKPDIAVSCISNWPLDASKMNRMLTVYRMDINTQQLVETFQSIFEEIKDQQKDKLMINMLNESQLNCQEIQQKIANIYLNYLKNLKDHDKKYESFHGPRDFFSACKQICAEEINFFQSEQRCDQSSNSIKSLNDRIIKAFYRHFSGLEASQQLLQKQFIELNMNHSYEFRPSELIEQNLMEEPKFFTSRHLMVISDDIQNAMTFLKSKLSSREHQFFIGSDFADDKKMQACYNVINKIVSCIEKGMVVTLLNLDNIYQSLYEVLNQSYRYYNGKYFCKISFGAESSNIEVSQNFKLILLVNQNQIHRMDGPLLNRFEKHLLKDNMILSGDDADNIQILQKNFKQVEDYFCQHEKIAQTRYPLFKFTNKDSVVQNYYLQYKLQKEKAVGSNKDCKITDEEQEKIFMRIFNLTNFLSVFLKRDQPYINTMLDSYEKSEYHYSLSGFIQNRIYNQNINEHLISEWAYFQQKNKIKECQVRQFAVISQQTFITDSITSKLDVITLSQIVSEQDLVKKLTNFLNRGLPQIPQVQTKRFQTTFAQKKNMTDCLDDKYNSKQLQSDIKFMHNPIRVDQDILIVTGDMSKSGGDSYDRIVFTMHKIDECVDQFLANTKDQSVDSQNYSLQLNIIFVLKVEESYKMIPVEGRWENHSIEDLTPFHQFYNQQQDIGQLELNREIKQKLSMQNIMNDKNIQIQNVIGLDVITRFFIENDQQIFANAYRVIQYFPSSEINESEYKVEKLNQITKIFMEKYKDALIPIISQISYKIMKYQYSIDTFNGLVINYMIPKGFSVQSSSFHSCILAALEKIIETSITIIIYDLESNKLTYGMFKCEVPQFIQHSKSQINQIPDKYKSSSQDYLNPLKMCKNVVISESQEIFRVLNSYQMTIKHLKENIIEGQNELFQKMYKSVRENLRSYENILYLFSEQILMDILDENPGQINKIDIQIAQIILLIRKRIDRIDISEIQEQEQVNIKPFQSSQDTIIAIFLTLFILEDEIKDIRDFVEYYQLSIDNLRDEFVEMNRNNNLQFVQSIDLLKQMIIQRMFETVKPTSRYVQENKLLNQNYPAFTKLFLEYVDKNNTSYQYQHMKNQIVLVNIICEEFSEILVKKNLLINMKFDNIISLDYKELTEMRELFQVFYQDLYQEMRQSNIQNQQVYDNKQFIYKWNDFLKTLIISSTENNYYRIFSPHIIKILLQLEFDERDMHSCLSLQFRVFLNRVFKQISQCLSFESVQKSFCLDLQELFSDKNGQPYHIEYYTFQQFSETIQNCVYSYLLNEKANENIEFLFTLIEHEFSSLQTLQKVIYLSIFREFVYQMINVDDISKSLLAQKIYECSKNSMEVEDQYQNCYTTLDEQLQKYFLKLNYQPFQNFIIKNLLFFKKSIINFMNESFYLKNCNWLLNYIQDQFNYNQIYEISYQNQQLIAIQNKQQSLENMIFQQIPNCQNVFKELYNGIIQQDKYYPFNLQNYVQSKIDFYNVQQGDNLKSLYQCFLCRNFIVVDNNNQQFNNINVQCLSCLSNLSLNNQNEAILILNGLENKIGLRQSVQQQIGFCLRLDQITLCYNVNQQLPEIQALFNMLYHICLKLSLNLNPYNQLKQVTKIQYYTYDKQNNTVVTQEKSILLINKILNIPIEFDFMQYIDNQIYLSIETFQFIINQKRQYNQCKVMYLIKYLTEYLMHSNIQVTQLANQTQQNMAIQNQILIKMQEFDQLYSYQFAILSEDLSHCNLTQQTYIQSHPISLRLIYKNKDDNIIQNMKLNHQQNLQQYFPILLEYLDFDYLNFIHNSLKNFVIFYQQIIIYFSNQFEVTEAYKLTLKDALNKLKLDVSDQFYNWYLEQFVPCWNSVLQQIQNQCQDQQNLNQFLKKIDAKTQLLDLIYSSKYNTMFSAMLEYLCSIQNQLIQKLITYCQQNQQTPHVNKLYKDIWIQFLNRQGSQKTYGLQDIKPDLDIIKVPEKDLVEKFICQGQEYGDYIYNRKLYEFDSLQTSVIKSIFKKARLINLEKSIQFQFLLSFNELSPQNNEMTIPQEKIQQDIVQNLKQLLIDQDLVKEAYNKMLTIQSFFKSSPIQQSETSLSTAMKQINMNFNFQKLQNILEKCLLLKHLKDFIKLLEELNMNKFVQFCNLSYRVIQQNEIFNQLLQYIFSNQNLLTDFKLSIGRIIIRFLSSEKVQIDPQLSLLNIFQDQQFKIGCESQYFASQEFKNQIQPFKVCNCYQIYELITFYQGFEFKKTNLVQADGLFLENFTDDVFKKSIRELTLQQNQNK